MEILISPGEYETIQAYRGQRRRKYIRENLVCQLTPGEEDFLMTGATPEEWDSLMYPAYVISTQSEDFLDFP